MNRDEYRKKQIEDNWGRIQSPSKITGCLVLIGILATLLALFNLYDKFCH